MAFSLLENLVLLSHPSPFSYSLILMQCDNDNNPEIRVTPRNHQRTAT
jgi:hypothetical protein